MTSHGKDETKILIKNLEDQLERLIQQLEDLDGCRDELDSVEYEETKKDTVDQMNELNESLKKMLLGDITLIDDLGAMQLATQAAISESFKTPAVIRMFGKKEPKQLRERFALIQREMKLGKIDKKSGEQQLREILTALKHLGEKLNSEEIKSLDTLSYNTIGTSNLIQLPDCFENGHEILEIASQDVRASRDI